MKRRNFLFGSALAGGIGLSGLAAALFTHPAAAGPFGPHRRFGHAHGFCGAPHGNAAVLDGDELRAHLAAWLRPAKPSDEQLERIGGIAEDATADLCAIREHAEQQHEAIAAALTGATIDRAAIEAARSAGLERLSSASERALRALADAAEVLTPEQRRALAAAHEERHDGGWHRHRWF
jgi:Spy/CpxP family protein refolding chaperone